MLKDPNWQVFTDDENRAAMNDGLREISLIYLSEILRSIVKYKIQRKIAQVKNVARSAMTECQNFYKQVEAMRAAMFDPDPGPYPGALDEYEDWNKDGNGDKDMPLPPAVTPA